MIGSPDLRRIEAATYTVGAVIVLLFAVQALSGLAVELESMTVRRSFPPLSDTFWVSVSAQVLDDILFFLGALFLIVLAWRAHRAVARPRA